MVLYDRGRPEKGAFPHVSLEVLRELTVLTDDRWISDPKSKRKINPDAFWNSTVKASKEDSDKSKEKKSEKLTKGDSENNNSTSGGNTNHQKSPNS